MPMALIIGCLRVALAFSVTDSLLIFLFTKAIPASRPACLAPQNVPFEVAKRAVSHCRMACFATQFGLFFNALITKLLRRKLYWEN